MATNVIFIQYLSSSADTTGTTKNKSLRLTFKTQGLKKQTSPLLFSSLFLFFLYLVEGKKSVHDHKKQCLTIHLKWI